MSINDRFIKVRVRLGKDGQEFSATCINGKCTNCYLSIITIDDIEFQSLVVTIPSNTYSDNGYLWVAVTTHEESEHFSDGTKDTESIFEKTEVQYVYQ